MKITRSAFAKAVAKQLAPGKRIASAEVQKTLQQMGMDPRFKGEVKEYQLRGAFETLKEKGLLKSSAAATGTYAFSQTVKQEAHHEANPGLSKEKQLAHSKSLLRERLDEEAAKKQRMTEALNGVQKGTRDGTKQAASHASGKSLAPPAMAKAPVPRVSERTDTAARSYNADRTPLVQSPLDAAQKGDTSAQESSEPSPRIVPSSLQGRRETQDPPDMFGPDE